MHAELVTSLLWDIAQEALSLTYIIVWNAFQCDHFVLVSSVDLFIKSQSLLLFYWSVQLSVLFNTCFKLKYKGAIDPGPCLLGALRSGWVGVLPFRWIVKWVHKDTFLWNAFVRESQLKPRPDAGAAGCGPSSHSPWRLLPCMVECQFEKLRIFHDFPAFLLAICKQFIFFKGGGETWNWFCLERPKLKIHCIFKGDIQHFRVSRSRVKLCGEWIVSS